MTVTLNLNKITLPRDLKTLKTIFDAGRLELVEPLKNFLHKLDISLEPHPRNNVCIQVSLEEFALIGVFNGSF